MFVRHDAAWEPERAGDGLNAAEREFLWCLRRLAMLRPLGAARDAHVHLALQLRFGDAGLAAEHLLRCLIVGLAQRALRPVLLHRPCCAGCSSDEARLLLALRAPAQAAPLLAPLAGARAAELEPILAGLGALIGR